MGFTAVKEAVEDFRRHRNDKEVNTRPANVVKSDGSIGEVQWQEVKVGDILSVENGEFFPADLLILTTSEDKGMCYIDTANLDGENNLKIRQAVPATAAHAEAEHELRGSLHAEAPDESLYAFAGTLKIDGEEEAPVASKQMLLRGARLRNTKWVTGLVVYTGKDARIMQSASEPRLKKSKVEHLTNYLTLFMFVIQTLLCIGSAICSSLWTDSNENTTPYLQLEYFDANISKVRTFFTFVILYSNFIPISLYVTLETVKYLQSYLIDSDLEMYDETRDSPCTSRTSNLNEELGMVEYIFSDKTGTLTRNHMDFKKCSIGGRAYGEGTNKFQKAREGAWGSEGTQPKMDDTPFGRGEECNHVVFDDEEDRMRAAIEGGNEAVEMFLLICGVAHTVIPDEEAEDGSEEHEKNEGVVYQAASPDEGALVHLAACMGWEFHTRTSDTVRLTVYGEEREYAILAINEYSSERKRMSIVCRTPDGRVLVLCKGADEVMLETLDKGDKINSATLEATKNHLETFAEEGLRTLVLAYKEISEDEFQAWEQTFTEANAVKDPDEKDEKLTEVAEELEQNLILVGASAIEDELQQGVPETIEDLRRAGVKIWVLTGDKQETAVMIGYTCQLIGKEMELVVPSEGVEMGDNGDAGRGQILENIKTQLTSMEEGERDPERGSPTQPQQYALVLDGRAVTAILGNPDGSDTGDGRAELADAFLKLATQCAVVVGCRVSPQQKAQVVKFIQTRLKPVTLAIGDGANDVEMIKAAHIGVGITGEEGSQAAMSADYAIGQFRFLAPLLLVHGHWCYRRIATLIFYSFYKNAALALISCWFSFFSGFSGQSFTEKWTFSLYNVFWAALPIMALGLYDQSISRPVLREMPELYKTGIVNHFFTVRAFAGWVSAAVYHSLVCFFVTEALFYDSVPFTSGRNDDLEIKGLVVIWAAVVAVNAKSATQVNTWNIMNFLAYFLSFAAFFGWTAGYSFAAPVIEDSWNFYHVGVEVLCTPRFWFAILLVPVICLIPDLVWQYVQRWYRPEPHHIAREIGVRARPTAMPDEALTESAPLLKHAEAGVAMSATRRGTRGQNRANVRTSLYEPGPRGHVERITSSNFVAGRDAARIADQAGNEDAAKPRTPRTPRRHARSPRTPRRANERGRGEGRREGGAAPQRTQRSWAEVAAAGVGDGKDAQYKDEELPPVGG